MAKYLLHDIRAMLRGVKKVAEIGFKYQAEDLNQRLSSSSLRPLAQSVFCSSTKKSSQAQSFSVQEIASRTNAVLQGIQEQVKIVTGFTAPTPSFALDNGFTLYSHKIGMNRVVDEHPTTAESSVGHGNSQLEGEAGAAAKRAEKFMNPPVAPLDPQDKNDAGRNLDVSQSLEADVSAANAHKLGNLMQEETSHHSDKFRKDSTKTFIDGGGDSSIRMEDIKKISKRYYSSLAGSSNEGGGQKPNSKLPQQSPKAEKQTLGPKSRERKVPASRTARLASFGGLAAGLGMGALAEVTRRTLGMGEMDKSAFLTDANVERFVETLCRVRGAALKLGQMLSIQDTSILSPQVQKIFERVRQSADFMPKSQMEKIMEKELGVDWRKKFPVFEDKPFAAASIGQVHFGKMVDGREVAVKIQYPGVAEGIDSDIKNLMTILKMWNIFPKGMYMDNLMNVARVELAWECDYIREAKYIRRFREILKGDPIFVVPDVIGELSSNRVLTTEYIYGDPLDKALTYDQETRNLIAKSFLRLCFEELFLHRLMQTDPNWANFFYNHQNKKIYLLDFGATRSFDKSFTDDYIKIIKGAATGDRDLVLKSSQRLGFLTGMETKVLEAAHVDAAMILGEPFKTDAPFDFGNQDITKRIHTIIPLMAEQRLTPPPSESYSLHRKIAGAFLLCANMKAKIPCKQVFDDIYSRYQNQSGASG